MAPQRPPRRIAVASDQSLVGEAVRTALASRGLEAFLLAWSGPRRRQPEGHLAPGGADAVLLLCDLDVSTSLREARLLAAAQGDLPQLVLTPAPRGARWGALLDLGVQAVLSNDTTLDEVVDALEDVAAGRPLMTPEDRESLIEQWRSDRVEKDQLLGRMRSLSPRERTVLRLLHAGDDVRSIAEMLGVSEATVRSHVKAIRRKLQVSSQLAAVAAFDWLRDESEHREPWSFPDLRQRGPTARR
jgi:RNA polymerase sigma factor (sigma-70 family)